MIELDASRRQRLRSLADDCEERARLPACDPYARSLFHRTAADARCIARTLTGEGLELALQAALATARFAACINGDEYAAPATSPLERVQAPDAARCRATAVASAGEPPTGPLLSTRQLAALSNITDRTARRTIEHGMIRRIPGFYREGWRWYAEREAFERLRGGVSELCPSALPVPSSHP